MPALIEMLHDNDIYVIGRITVFQDPFEANRSPQWAVKKPMEHRLERRQRLIVY